MTITSAVSRIEYTGNGLATAYPFPNFVLDSDDLIVYVDSVLQVIVDDYTLSEIPPQPDGVDINFVTPPVDNAEIIILRDPPITQAVDLVENDSLPVEIVEGALDKLTMIVQRLDDRIGRALILPDTSVGVDAELPAPLPNRLLGWNASGDGLANFANVDTLVAISPFMETVIDDLSAAAALTTLGAPQLTAANAWSGVNTFTGLSPLVFDGAVAGGFTVTFTMTEPTANRVITFPDEDITVGEGGGGVLRGWIGGLTMSTAGGSPTMTVSVGEATDSTGAVSMTLATEIDKGVAAWAVGDGNGGIDTGSIADDWYNFFEIYRSDTEVVDVVFSLAATPSMPANYTHFRRIGAAFNSSGNWLAFKQHGDWFRLDTPFAALGTATTTPGTLRTVSCAPGVICEVLITITLRVPGTGTGSVNHWDPALGTTPPQTDVGIIECENPSATDSITVTQQFRVRTNTSSQIYNMLIGNHNALDGVSEGWWDRRGQDD